MNPMAPMKAGGMPGLLGEQPPQTGGAMPPPMPGMGGMGGPMRSDGFNPQMGGPMRSGGMAPQMPQSAPQTGRAMSPDMVQRMMQQANGGQAVGGHRPPSMVPPMPNQPPAGLPNQGQAAQAFRAGGMAPQQMPSQGMGNMGGQMGGRQGIDPAQLQQLIAMLNGGG